jgi:ketosteroid isomerase-like protein
MLHKALCFVVMCLMFASQAVAQTKPAEKKSAPSGVPDKALIQEILNAWGTMDTSVVGKYYDHAPTNVFYDVSPLKFDGWAQYTVGVNQLFNTLKSINFSVNDDAAVHHAGNLAWGNSTVKTVMTDKTGKVTRLDCRWTIVWEKKGADWLIVHDHFSVPMGPE